MFSLSLSLFKHDSSSWLSLAASRFRRYHHHSYTSIYFCLDNSTLLSKLALGNTVLQQDTSIAIAKSEQALWLAGDSHKIWLVSIPWKEGGVIGPPLSESTGTPSFFLLAFCQVYIIFYSMSSTGGQVAKQRGDSSYGEVVTKAGWDFIVFQLPELPLLL